MQPKFLFALILLSPFVVYLGSNSLLHPASPPLANKSDLLGNLLLRILRIVESFEQDSHAVNLDGLFGIRIAQAVFAKLHNMDFIETDLVLNYKLSLSLGILKERLYLLADKVAELVRVQTPDYYRDFELLINQPFLLQPPDRQSRFIFSQQFTKTSSKNSQLDEKFSDACYSLLMRNNSIKACATNDACIQFFLQPDASEYYLTHQLLYFMIAERIGCADTLLDQIDKSVAFKNLTFQLKPISLDRIYRHYCAKIFQETADLYQGFENRQTFQNDLFIEQNLLCGLLGKQEFLKEDTLMLIFLSQQSSGCFGGNSSKLEVPHAESIEQVLDSINESFMGQNQIPPSNIKHRRRVKRYDSLMRHGCSSHETGLAVAYFSTFLQKLLLNLNN